MKRDPSHDRPSPDASVYRTRRQVVAGGVLLALGAIVGSCDLLRHELAGSARSAGSTGTTAPLAGGTTQQSSTGSPGPQCATARSGAPEGGSYTGRFFSKYRNTEVNYTLAYPPGYDKGDRLPLALFLHAYGGNYRSSYGGRTLAEALALRPGGSPLAPMAMICPDGGNLYWHAHPGDDPMGMLLHEIVPMCQQLGLGRAADGNEIVATGISMGGFGALLLAEQQPALISAVSVMSPAIWNTYAESLLAGGVCWTSPADFAANDVTGDASALNGRPVRIACGQEDPFHGYVEVLQAALPEGSVVVYPPGGHDDTFWAAQAPDALGFLSTALAGRPSCRDART